MKKQLNIKKLILLNLPYILMGLFSTNFGEAWRMAVGADASAKMLSFFSMLACVWRCISKVKTPRSTVTAWSMALPVGEPVRISNRSWIRSLQIM